MNKSYFYVLKFMRELRYNYEKFQQNGHESAGEDANRSLSNLMRTLSEFGQQLNKERKQAKKQENFEELDKLLRIDQKK